MTKTFLTCAACALGLLAVVPANAAPAGSPTRTPSLDEYRHFRALSIDLQGRIPLRDELAAFEAQGFDLDAWVDHKLTGPAYADRVARIYMDLLRLQVGPVVRDASRVVGLARETIVGPDGNPIYVFHRTNQRRLRPETDGDFCMTADETGLQFRPNNPPIVYPVGAPRTTGTPVTQAVLDANTVLVKPWWLYKDYASASPSQRYETTSWAATYGFKLVNGLTMEADGKTPTMQIRICKEEAQSTDVGHVMATGRVPPPAGTPPPFGRVAQLPLDDTYAKQHTGEAISCRTDTSFVHASDCGCGAGLEHCFPVGGSVPNASPSAFGPDVNALGTDLPLDDVQQAIPEWNHMWWSEEARHFMLYLFGEDRDFREMLTAPYTFVNGPLTQYYKASAPASCCGQGVSLGYTAPVPLFDPAGLPQGLLPFDARTWQEVPSRSPLAAGLLTMPVFLVKYGTRRSKAHVLYNAFLCKDFIAPPNLQLTPSTNPNLMTRSGCNSCHATLEPMAAYFSRIVESDVTYLPPQTFPVDTKAACSGTGTLPAFCQCKADAKGKLNGVCSTYFDPAFSDGTHSLLRGAYPDAVGASKGHADAGPIGMAKELTAHPEFAACVAQNVATSFLGRGLGSEDATLKQTLTTTLTGSGFKMRAVVKAMLMSDAYRRSNDLSASAWRRTQGGAP